MDDPTRVGEPKGRPAQIDRAGQMIAEVLRVHVLVEAEAAVDYTHIGVAHAGGDAVGGPEKVRPRERGHERHSIRVSLAGPSARRKVSMRIVVAFTEPVTSVLG